MARKPSRTGCNMAHKPSFVCFGHKRYSNPIHSFPPSFQFKNPNSATPAAAAAGAVGTYVWQPSEQGTPRARSRDGWRTGAAWRCGNARVPPLGPQPPSASARAGASAQCAVLFSGPCRRRGSLAHARPLALHPAGAPRLFQRTSACIDFWFFLLVCALSFANLLSSMHAIVQAC